MTCDTEDILAHRRLWRAALGLILADFETEACARAYFRSRDGQTVLGLAGYEGVPRLGRGGPFRSPAGSRVQRNGAGWLEAESGE